MAAGSSMTVLRGLVVRTLLEDASVAAIAAGRISGAFPEDVDIQDADYPLVVATFRAGLANYNPVVSTPVFEIWAYARTGQGEATGLYDACFAALQAELLVAYDGLGSVIMRVNTQETQRATEGWNDRTRSWYCQGRWLARTIG